MIGGGFSQLVVFEGKSVEGAGKTGDGTSVMFGITVPITLKYLTTGGAISHCFTAAFLGGTS